MVHALREAHRVLKPNGILVDLRPAPKHRRAGLGEGKRWRQVGVMREKFDDDIASDRAVRQVIRERLFHMERQIEFDLDRVMDTLPDFRAWLDDFSTDKLPSHDWLYERVERALAGERKDTKIVVRGLLRLAVLRKQD
jgi:SAM-dependent methyltransferase